MPINVGNYENQVELLTRTNTIINDLSKAGKTPRRQVYTSNGTWTAPEGVTRIFVTGGGGGGGGSISAANNSSTSGGVTSFGNLLSLSGGGGASNGSANSAIEGSKGGKGGESGKRDQSHFNGTTTLGAGSGGSVALYKGGSPFVVSASSNFNSDGIIDGGYCCGGGGVTTSVSTSCPGGGSGDFVIKKELQVTPGSYHNIVIGVGGLGERINSSTLRGGNGGDGILIIEWWE